MNKRIRLKLEKQGKLPEKEVAEPTPRWKPEFSLEQFIIPLYRDLAERDTSHPLLQYGAIENGHFRPSSALWIKAQEVLGISNANGYDPAPGNDLPSMGAYALRLRIAARTIDERMAQTENQL